MRKSVFLFCAVMTAWCTVALAGPLPEISTTQLLAMINQSRGKVTVVNFWASFCPPCRLEIPELASMRNDYSEDELSLIGVSLDVTNEAAQAFLSSLKVNYPMYLADPGVASTLGITLVPKLLVYNAEGVQVVSHDGYLPGESLRKIVDELLENGHGG